MFAKNNVPAPLKKALEYQYLAGGASLIFGMLSFFGFKEARAFRDQANEIKLKAQELAQLPYEFQRRFQQHGWLLSESTDVNLAKEAIELFDSDKPDEANELLCTQFEGSKLDFFEMRCRHLSEIKPRLGIVRSAVNLSHAKQFVGVVPLILIVMDGVGSDAFGKSIFSEGIDVSELKAIAGSADGFPQLLAEVGKLRRPTNTEELSFPYRHGIMHGKDVNFGNRLVTAKCWGLLSCLVDILNAKRVVQKVKPKTTLLESLKSLQETQKMGQRLEQWIPRALIKIHENGEYENQNFLDNTPEKLLCSFLSYWKSNNYGKIGELTVYYDNRPINKRAGEIRNDLSNVRLISARILNIIDYAPSVTLIDCDLQYETDNKILFDKHQFRLVFLNDAMDILLRNEEGGRWLVEPSYQGWALNRYLQATRAT